MSKWECARCGNELSSKPMALERCKECECPAWFKVSENRYPVCEKGLIAKASKTICVGCSTTCPFDWQSPDYPYTDTPEDERPSYARIDVVGQNGNDGEHYEEAINRLGPKPVYSSQLGRARLNADAHWEWVKGLLEAAGTDEDVLSVCGYIYRTAYIHGAKHEREGDHD